MASALVASASTTTSPTSPTTTTVTRNSPVASGETNNSSSGNEQHQHQLGISPNDHDEHGACGPEERSREERSSSTSSAHDPKQQQGGSDKVAQHQQDAEDSSNLDSTISSSVAPSTTSTAEHNELPGRTVGTTKASPSSKAFGEGPLPRELRRIIAEVARTGKCSWLSWNKETNTLPGAFSFAQQDETFAAVASSTARLTTPKRSPYATSLSSSVRKPSYGGAAAAAARRSTGLPPRKRHRNGVMHKGRFGNADGTYGRSASSSTSRKRPLVPNNANNHHHHSNSPSATNHTTNLNNHSNIPPALHSVSNPTTTSTNASSNSSSGLLLYSSAPSSVGSGRSTGSEPDYDSAPYECDSEGTSATTNSEISGRYIKSGAKRLSTPQGTQGITTPLDDKAILEDDTTGIPGSPYKTLQTAFRGALGLVLDHFYQNKDNGYKLSPAEKRRNERFAETVNGDSSTKMNSDKLASLLSSEYVFQQRRQRLMALLLPGSTHPDADEPPFTIQRIAEVLVAPDRYYTQTHKLCNCLEKLLLVNSSTESFGGSTGGDTSQRRSEDRELAALADEKGRQEIQLRQRQLANRGGKSPSLEDFGPDDHSSEPYPLSHHSTSIREDLSAMQHSHYEMKTGTTTTMGEKANNGGDSNNNNNNNEGVFSSQNNATTAANSSTSREMLEALARASLRTKFDHVGLDPQHNPSSNNAAASSNNERDGLDNRDMTNSPPLSGLNVASATATMSVTGHGGLNGYTVRQQQQQHLSEQQHQGSEQGSVPRAPSPILFPAGNESHLETTASNMHMLQLHHAVALAGVSLNRGNNPPTTLDNLMTIDANTISQMRSQANASGTGPGSESTDGRSSASNSDIDSESDDISFDDSASDRSDGSDSGSTSNIQHHEPFTAARAMALNRMQQQQRLLQSRILTSLGASSQTAEGFRPDSEYQSGDSIDSTRADDSGGSDSSSSDMAD